MATVVIINFLVSKKSREEKDMFLIYAREGDDAQRVCSVAVRDILQGMEHDVTVAYQSPSSIVSMKVGAEGALGILFLDPEMAEVAVEVATRKPEIRVAACGFGGRLKAPQGVATFDEDACDLNLEKHHKAFVHVLTTND